MEHIAKHTTASVLTRYMRRRWKLPLQLMGGAVILMLLMGFGAFRGHRNAAIPADDLPTGPAPLANGVVESLYGKGVGAPYEGTIGAVLVKEGQKVRKGQVVFRMDTSGLKQDLAAAREELASAAGALRKARAESSAELRAPRQTIAAIEASIAREREKEKASMRAAVTPVGFEEPAADEAPWESEPADAAAVERAYEERPLEPQRPADYNPARIHELEAGLAAARAQVQERWLAWEPILAAAEERYTSALREVKHLRSLIGAAERHSPLDGVVTEIHGAAGQSVASHRPVVRIDNPAGYRVVAMVDMETRDTLKPGLTVALGNTGGKLQKIVRGVDRDVFYYYVWMKPVKPSVLKPGQQVTVALPGGASQVASAGL